MSENAESAAPKPPAPKLVVMSRDRAESYRLKKEVPHAIVSIGAPGDKPAKLRNYRCLLGVLRLSFDDAEVKFRSRSGYENTLIDDEQAEQIIRFALGMRDRGVKLIICHCEAGISRSSATAAGLAHLFRKRTKRFFRYPYSPNALVYKKLIAAQARILRDRSVAAATTQI